VKDKCIKGIVKSFKEHKDMNELFIEVRSVSDPFGIEAESPVEETCRWPETPELVNIGLVRLPFVQTRYSS